MLGEYCLVIEPNCLVIEPKKRRLCNEIDCSKFARDKTGKCKRHGGGTRCNEPSCKSSTQGKSDKCVFHGGGLRCNEPDCKKGAQGKTGKCFAHGGGTKCNEPDCKSSAVGKSDKCKLHGGGTRCNEPGCKTSARAKSGKCIFHGGGTKCNEPDCKSSAREKSDKCKLHGGGTRCNKPDCKSSAVDKTNKCKLHGGGTRCNEPGCKTSARAKSDKCIFHGGGVRCIETGCKTGAASKSDKCRLHGGGNRCPYCIDHIDSRCGSSKYDGYCATCFKRVFPNDPRSKVIYSHTKEMLVRNTINEHFEGFIHDVPLYTGNCDCTHRRRIDHRKLIGNTILAVETDEFGHVSYDKYDEEIRYDDLYMIHSGKWIFIRFNPDSNIDKTDIDDKLDKLIDTMEYCIEQIENEDNTELLEIIKLYC